MSKVNEENIWIIEAYRDICLSYEYYYKSGYLKYSFNIWKKNNYYNEPDINKTYDIELDNIYKFKEYPIIINIGNISLYDDLIDIIIENVNKNISKVNTHIIFDDNDNKSYNHVEDSKINNYGGNDYDNDYSVNDYYYNNNYGGNDYGGYYYNNDYGVNDYYYNNDYDNNDYSVNDYYYNNDYGKNEYGGNEYGGNDYDNDYSVNDYYYNNNYGGNDYGGNDYNNDYGINEYFGNEYGGNEYKPKFEVSKKTYKKKTKKFKYYNNKYNEYGIETLIREIYVSYKERKSNGDILYGLLIVTYDPKDYYKIKSNINYDFDYNQYYDKSGDNLHIEKNQFHMKLSSKNIYHSENKEYHDDYVRHEIIDNINYYINKFVD